MSIFHKHSSLRIFAFSALVTIATLFFVWEWFGWAALLTAAILIVIEVTFSFDNAIINAKILEKLSRPWQTIFLTIGILIAVFGMRLVFPIVIVSLSTGLGWQEVVDLALNHPEVYSHKLESANPVIAGFGGAFLLMLALHFFFDSKRQVTWLGWLEKPLQKIPPNLGPIVVTTLIIGAVSFSLGQAGFAVLEAGIIGAFTYLALHGLTQFFTPKNHGNKVLTGWAAFTMFIYLEMIDASFSFDAVIGAFAITSDVILIALGLGVGALWVRSLTIFMVRRQTLNNYLYLEHGAHYTIAALALAFLIGIIVHIPELFTGLFGIAIIAAAVYSSIKAAPKR